MTKFITVQNNVQKEKKETVFTHFLGSIWYPTTKNPKDFSEVFYLGGCALNGHLFMVKDDADITIYKGIKGDEFND